MYAITKTKTIALVISPFGMDRDIKKENISNYDKPNKELLEQYESFFNIPVFSLGENELARKLLKLISKTGRY